MWKIAIALVRKATGNDCNECWNCEGDPGDWGERQREHEGTNMVAFRFTSYQTSSKSYCKEFISENGLRTRQGGGFYYTIS